MWRALPALVLVAGLVVGHVGGATAADPVPDSTDPTKPLTPTDPLHPGSTTAPELALVDVGTTSALTSAKAGEQQAKAASAQAVQDKADLEQKLLDLAGQKTDAATKLVAAGQAVDAAKQQVVVAQAGVDDATRVVTDRQAARTQADTAVATAKVGLKDAVLSSYVYGDEPNIIDVLGKPDDFAKVELRRSLDRAGSDARLRLLAQRRRELAQAEAALAKALTDLGAAKATLGARQQDQRDREQDQRNAQQHVADVDQSITDTTSARDQAITTIATRLLEQVDATKAVADARVLAPVTGADFPLVALDAYWRAAHRAPCKIEWWAIAGIAYHESRNGTEGGSRIDATGHTTKPIIGVALDGSGGNAAIHDTDGGTLDGDTVWDRAVGPMQFIPSTWRSVATDGDGDKKADPADLYDAAATTAKYLCAGRPDLTTDAGLSAAYLSYNQSAVYVRVVLATARQYQHDVIIPPIPPTPPG